MKLNIARKREVKKISNIYQIKASDSRREFEIEIQNFNYRSFREDLQIKKR
jgi:hypothetical protein